MADRSGARAKRVTEWVDANGPHRDENFTIPERGLREINEAVFRVVAVGPVLNSFHRLAPF